MCCAYTRCKLVCIIVNDITLISIISTIGDSDPYDNLCTHSTGFVHTNKYFAIFSSYLEGKIA